MAQGVLIMTELSYSEKRALRSTYMRAQEMPDFPADICTTPAYGHQSGAREETLNSLRDKGYLIHCSVANRYSFTPKAREYTKQQKYYEDDL